MSKLSRIKEEVNALADNWLKVTGARKSEVVNELYITLHQALKNDYHKIARSIGEGVHESDVEIAYCDAFMKCLERFTGGDFTNLFSTAAKNKRKDLARTNIRRINRHILETDEKETDEDKPKLNMVDYYGADFDYTLDNELYEKPANDTTRREIIRYLVGQAGDEVTESIVEEWLDATIEENNILAITKRLGINYSTAWRKIKKLANYYDDKAFNEFGYIEKYIKH